MGCAIKCEAKRLDEVRADRVRVTDSSRSGQLIQAGVRPVQEVRVQLERIRNLLLCREQAHESGLFPADLVIYFAHILAIIFVSWRVVDDASAWIRCNSILVQRVEKAIRDVYRRFDVQRRRNLIVDERRAENPSRTQIAGG